MKRYIFIIAMFWGLILTAEPALANCETHSYLIDGKWVMCTTCCYPGSGCQTTCN